MKTLVLIRHSEAEESSEDLSDFKRTLTNSGKKDAAKTAAVLLKQKILPQVIVSSPALRALATAHIFTEALSLGDVETDSEIYEANVNTLLRVISQLDNQFDTIALVGHNPGISNLLYFMTGKITTMTTSSWAGIELEIDTWAEISSDNGKLIHYQYP